MKRILIKKVVFFRRVIFAAYFLRNACKVIVARSEIFCLVVINGVMCGVHSWVKIEKVFFVPVSFFEFSITIIFLL